jgi:hypothetical protein
VIRPVAVFAVAGVLFATAGCTDFVTECRPMAPNVLPDGSPPGEPRPDDQVVAAATRWGDGANAVREVAVSVSPGEVAGVEITAGVTVRTWPTRIVASGGASVGAPGFTWWATSCRYTVLLDASLTPDQVRAYAARF